MVPMVYVIKFSFNTLIFFTTFEGFMISNKKIWLLVILKELLILINKFKH